MCLPLFEIKLNNISGIRRESKTVTVVDIFTIGGF